MRRRPAQVVTSEQPPPGRDACYLVFSVMLATSSARQMMAMGSSSRPWSASRRGAGLASWLSSPGTAHKALARPICHGDRLAMGFLTCWPYVVVQPEQVARVELPLEAAKAFVPCAAMGGPARGRCYPGIISSGTLWSRRIIRQPR